MTPVSFYYPSYKGSKQAGAFVNDLLHLLIKLNPWRNSSEESRPTEAVSVRSQCRKLCD